MAAFNCPEFNELDIISKRTRFRNIFKTPVSRTNLFQNIILNRIMKNSIQTFRYLMIKLLNYHAYIIISGKNTRSSKTMRIVNKFFSFFSSSFS